MDFTSTAEAFRKARERSSIAAAFEADLLHTAVYDAREAGMSVRQASAALSVPKSTVSRHWREGHFCPGVVPFWGSPAAWEEAHAAIWSHDEQQLADNQPPYEWLHQDGTIQVTSQPRGRLALSDPAKAPTSCAGGVCGHCDRCRSESDAASA